MSDTLLTLIGMGVPLYSGRVAHFQLLPIEAAKRNRRDMNGVLVDTSLEQFHKYRAHVRFSDTWAPALDGIWIGRQLIVGWPGEIGFITSSAGPARSVVAGSERFTDDGFTYYRPVLTMLVADFDTDHDEWGASYVSSLEMEEI